MGLCEEIGKEQEQEHYQ
jgi:hypothetical protein